MRFFRLGILVVGLLACFVGHLRDAVDWMIAQLHVRWQIYNEYLLAGGEPIELAPWEMLPSEGAEGPPPTRRRPYGAE